MRGAAAFLFALPIVLLAGQAMAQSKQECLDAFDAAQHLRADGKLIEARARLQLCGSPSCPALVRSDCVQWENDVLAAIPTVTFAAHDAAGRDLLDVGISIDGTRVVDRLDGHEVQVDPGVHVVRFESAALGSAEQQLVVHASEKNRVVTATLGAPLAPAPTSAVAPAPEQTPVTSRPIPWLVPALAGVGVVSLVAAALLYFPVVSRVDDMRGSCAPGCSPDEVNSLEAKRDASWVLTGLGVAALAGAGALFALRPTVVAAPTTQGFSIQAVGRF
ncbi:MAG TPA: hypothetical protein VF765_33300 [Polyangiaceae bacterium]